MSNPFPGLRPFEVEENHFFFGRDAQVDHLIQKLSSNRFIAVLGASGTGKSSLIRAGVLPRFYGGFLKATGSDWRVAIFRPGSSPFRNLADALNRSKDSASSQNLDLDDAAATLAILKRSSLGLVNFARYSLTDNGENSSSTMPNLLVVVDQFEEIFRFGKIVDSNEYLDEVAAFIKVLLEGSRNQIFPIYVLINMRSDFLGDCDRFFELPEAINAGQFLVPRMTRDQCHEAIENPIKMQSARISRSLINRLLNDRPESSDQLSILQHALSRTWARWFADGGSGEIGIRHYEQIGGMSNALAHHGNEILAELNHDQCIVAEKIFKCVTETGSNDALVRRPATLSEICEVVEASEEKIRPVIDVFRREGTSFLMPPPGFPLTSDSIIDISHESLIRNWPRLRRWAQEENQSARVYLRLADSAKLYSVGNAGLLQQLELTAATNWVAVDRPNKAWAHRYNSNFEDTMLFLEKSVAVIKKKARRRNRLTALAVVVLSFLTITAAFFGWDARRQRALAETQSKVAAAAQKEAMEQRAIADAARKEAMMQMQLADDARQEALQRRSPASSQSQAALILAYTPYG